MHRPARSSSLDFQFFDADLHHSNLGGMGPDRNMPPSIRYVNVGSAAFGRGAAVGRIWAHFDLVVTNRSAYRPHDASLNGLNGRFAQINFAANTRVDLRVTVTRSCCVRRNCRACDAAGTAQQIAQCYAAGCCSALAPRGCN